MRIDYSRLFLKQFKKLPAKAQISFQNRLNIFVNNKFTDILNNHSLTGKLKYYRSINITGDLRAVFRELENGDVIFFLMIGTHSQLYN